MAGLFVVFEGADGSGKSTQVAAVAQALRSAGHEVTVTREPGGSDVAERLRQLVLDPALSIGDMTETLLFAAARSDHIAKTITPALQANQIVVSDRFVGSSIAYQGAGRGVSEDTVAEINRYAIGQLTPHLTVVLDLAETQAGARRNDRGSSVDRMESAPVGFQDAVRASFLTQAQADPERHLVIDANQPPQAITAHILNHLHAQFEVVVA